MNKHYILAFDHRVSLTKMFGEHGGTFNGREVDYRALKRIVFNGARLAAHKRGTDASDVGILVDEEYGAEIAREARTRGVALAMPAERSMQEVFELEYGDEFDAHIEAFDPDMVKVLAIADETIPAELRELSESRLRDLSEWLAPRRHRFMLELLVSPSPDQLADVGGDREAFQRELRPEIMRKAIAEYQEAGIEADVWKIEGMWAATDYRAIVDQARSGGRDHVETIILGAGASDEQVRTWLRAAGEDTGMAGFAIGRSTWAPTLEGVMAGRLDEQEAAEEIAARFNSYIDAFEGRDSHSDPRDRELDAGGHERRAEVSQGAR